MVDIEKINVEELIIGVKSGDGDAFSALVSQYEPLVTSLCRSYFPEPHDKYEEACAESRFALFKAAKSYDITARGVSFGLYAKICITNALISMGRRDGKKKEQVYSLDEMGYCFGSETAIDTEEEVDPSEILIRREEVQELIRSAARTLSEYEFSVFQMYLDGNTTADIASLVGKSEKSVNNAIHRIKNKLRQQR